MAETTVRPEDDERLILEAATQVTLEITLLVALRALMAPSAERAQAQQLPGE